MTTAESSATSVTTSIDVETTAERAFTVFTERMDTWWNPDHHILQAPLARMVFEPRAGGSVYDVGTDGSECHWGTVLAYEPPHRLVFSWNITLQWTLEADPARCSEVEVTFLAKPDGGTLVTLTHSALDRHGDGWENMRGAVASPGGWTSGLTRLAEACRQA